MSGYYKQSMSNNAINAYASGRKPRSKWTKDDILSELPDEIKVHAKKCCLECLRYYFLYRSEWNHTGKYYSETDFYDIDSNSIDNFSLEELQSMDASCKKDAKEKREKKAKETYELASCTWGEWVGSRAHPKLEEHSGFCILKGNWAYTEEKTKKKIDGRHFEINRKYERAPYGKAKVFAEIKKYFDLK